MYDCNFCPPAALSADDTFLTPTGPTLPIVRQPPQMLLKPGKSLPGRFPSTHLTKYHLSILVPPMGLEPTHLSIPEPKSGAATNYAKGAKYGARGRNRTGTPLRTSDFKSEASTDFATRALVFQLYETTLKGI